MKKYSHLLSELPDLKVFVTRYGINFIVLIETILLPVLLSPTFYTEVEFLRYLFLVVPVLLWGAHSGYLYILYRRGEDLATALMVFSIVSGVTAALSIFLFLGEVFVAIAALLAIILISTEKVLIAKKKLVLASLH